MNDANRAINRARHLERLRQGRLELWRIRGATARSTGMPRALPQKLRDRHDADKAAAWLAGFDGRQRPARVPEKLPDRQRAGA